MPRKSWWARLPFGVRMAVGASAVLVVVGAGVAGVATVLSGGGGEPGPRIVTEVNQAAPAAPLPAAKPHADKPRVVPKNRGKADRRVTHAERVPNVAATTTPPPIASGPVKTPVQTVQTQVETKEIPYETRIV